MKKFKIPVGMNNLLLLWSSQSVSSLGTAMTNYALIIWVYQQKGSASSVAFLSVFTYLPSILFCFMAGTLADRWDKKKIMLASDLIAAMGTLSVFVLFGTGSLQIWHLYIINFLISLMNAFQNPATYVAVSLLTPKDQYVRVSGLYVLSDSLTKILTPALATAVLAFGGLKTVFTIDLVTFAVAFSALLFFIKIPRMPEVSREPEPFFRSCLQGLRFLKEHKAILKLILFFSFINLIAYMTGLGIMPAMILARSGDNQTVLGLVSSAVGIGTLVGSVFVTVTKPTMRKSKLIFLSCALSFLICNTLLGVGRNVWIWIFAALVGNLPMPFLSANISAVMRTKVPAQMQGRVFSTRDTIQFSTRPLGLFLGGVLADHVFEPLMRTASPVQHLLSALVGSGKGSGMALMFLLSGIIGCLASLLALRDPSYRDLDF